MRITAIAILVSAVVAGTAAPAPAQQAGPVCTSRGLTYQPGSTACIPACHGRQRLARCDLVGDVATWTTVSDTCPTAELSVMPGARRIAALEVQACGPAGAGLTPVSR